MTATATERAHYHKVYQARVYAKTPRLQPQPDRTDWITPARAGYLCDMCSNSEVPTPHAECERDRARAAGCLGKPPDGDDGRHGYMKTGGGTMVEEYRVSRSALRTADGMKGTGI